MVQFHCLNPIAACGLELFPDTYEKTDDFNAAEVALVRSAAMHDMELPKPLLAVARAGAGVNNIPLDKCAEQGIVVFNTPGANANGVKELVIAGMLLASRDITGGIDWVKENKEDAGIAKAAEKAKKAFAGTEIKGKKLGVIGLGAIGVQVANAAVALGMDVLGYDPYLSVNAAWNVSTKGMISKEAIAMMKANVIVLNFARDTLVDEAAMVEALKAGKVRKYVVDFPNPTTAGVENCIVIPHLGASTAESEDNCAVMAVQEVIDYIENGNITHSVNYPDCNMGVCTGAARIAILHKNIKNMIGQYSSVLGEAGVNIADMTNKSRNDYAYSLLDLDAPATADVVEKLAAIDGVLKVRVIK